MRKFPATRSIARLIVACTAAAATAAASQQQTPKLPGKVKDSTIAHANLAAYRSELRKYCAGDSTVISRLLAWDQRRLNEAVTIINTSLDDTRPWSLQDVKAAVLMHTEAALRLLRDDREETQAVFQLESASRVLVRGADPHLDPPDAEIEKRTAELRAFASRWYVAVSRFLRDQTRLIAARHFLALGRERLPHDAAVLYESGTLEEYVARFTLEKMKPEVWEHRTFSFGESVLNQMTKRRAEQLSDAERWLRESMTRDPARLDTQLHLGRVLMLLGHDEESARLLDPIAAAPSEYSYLAQMFRGAIEERRGALDAARDAYRRAATMSPWRQSALIALSQVLQRQGDGTQSRAVLDQLFAGASVAQDPWWLYFFELSQVARARVERLFAEVWR